MLADLEKAFLQVGLQPSERDVTRFLWLKDISKLDLNGNLQIYRFARVPFGVISSPFILGAAVAHHLKKKENPIAEKIRKNIYVDNVSITGTRTVVEAYDFYVEAKNIFQDASMNLREWMSNSTEFLSLIPDNDRAHGENIKVLGIHAPNIEMLNAVDTKRKLLQAVAAIFDPLGYFSPVILAAKLLLHKLWINGIDWDLPLNTQYLDEWKAIATELERISTIAIPRFIGIDEITPDTNYYLFCFCNASKFAFSTTIYLRISNHESQVNLLFAKRPLPPKKGTTLPRLELLGTLIGVRCLNFVQKELRLPIHKRILWTDSQCVLHWLVSKKLLNAFVENRLKEIRAQSNLNYPHIASTDNPADISTRSKTIEELENSSLWRKGPNWLTLPEHAWPTWDMPEITRETLRELEAETKGPKTLHETSTVASSNAVSTFELMEETYSNFSKLIRVTAWILRFTRNLKHKTKQTGSLTALELKLPKNIGNSIFNRRIFQMFTKP